MKNILVKNNKESFSHNFLIADLIIDVYIFTSRVYRFLIALIIKIK